MIENHNRHHRFSETNDCIEAAKILKRWKTIVLLLIIGSLVLLQASFYLVDQGYIRIDEGIGDKEPGTAKQDVENTLLLQYAAKWLPEDTISRITFDKLSWTINLVNVVLISAAFLYCLTLNLNLKISILGKLGGMKHITRACMLSSLIIVLLLPWQKLFDGIAVGAVFTPQEMVRWYSAKTEDVLGTGLYYLRFGGYGLSVFLLLIFSELASLLWDRAVQRRIRVREAEIRWGL